MCVAALAHRVLAGTYEVPPAYHRQQGVLVDFLAPGAFLGGVGRLVSMAKVGLPEPRAVWLGYLVPELVLPVVIVIAHPASR